MMLGFGSMEIALAYWLSIGATVLCVVYGIVNWNESGESSDVKPPQEDA
ncbi:symporter small accessory protein [Pseudodesulfovibrio sp. zrk46]